ncbi:MAG: cytochrome c [Bacteriovoracaceae bacterium]|jgi:mono/diheme cytochrome c family protein|nr:cytochrome c [Bacteriovoracaceae bacterium]
MKKQSENKTSFYVSLFIAFMVVLSLIVAWIMAKNLNQDSSKERFKLTKKYKKLKKEEYSYNSQRGHKLYLDLCAKCHRADGKGSNLYPPLVNSQVVKDNPQLMLKIIVKGLYGPMQREGKKYNSVMPGFKAIASEDLAHVANYIRKNFTQSETDIDALKVITTKIDTLTKSGSYQTSDLNIVN